MGTSGGTGGVKLPPFAPKNTCIITFVQYFLSQMNRDCTVIKAEKRRGQYRPFINVLSLLASAEFYKYFANDVTVR